MRGFSTLEMMIAMAVMVITFSAVIVVSYGNQGALIAGQTNAEAMNIAQKALEEAQQLARKDFRLVVASSSTYDIYTSETFVEPWSGDTFSSKKVTATVSWKDQRQQERYVTLTTILSNFMNAVGGDTCAAPTGDWRHPSSVDYSFASLSGVPAGTYTLSGFDAYRGKIYLGASSATAGQPTFFIFDISDMAQPPQLIGKLNTVSASAQQRGPRDVVAGNTALVSGAPHTYVYASNGYNANFNNCAAGTNCSQLQVIDVTNPAAPFIAANFKFATSSLSVPNPTPYVSGSAGQAYGEALFYKDGYVYLGLHTTGSGPEFNIIDVHNPLNPQAIGSGYHVGAEVHAISVRGKFAYLATGNNGNELLVLDISNPLMPVAVSGVYNPPGLNAGASVYTIGNSMYFGKQYAGGSAEFYIMDITNSGSGVQPLSASSKKVIGASVAGLVVRDTTAFVQTTTARVVYVYDISNPSSIGMYASPISMPGDGAALDCELNYLFAISNNGANGYITVVKPAP